MSCEKESFLRCEMMYGPSGAEMRVGVAVAYTWVVVIVDVR